MNIDTLAEVGIDTEEKLLQFLLDYDSRSHGYEDQIQHLTAVIMLSGIKMYMLRDQPIPKYKMYIRWEM